MHDYVFVFRVPNVKPIKTYTVYNCNSYDLALSKFYRFMNKVHPDVNFNFDMCIMPCYSEVVV